MKQVPFISYVLLDDKSREDILDYVKEYIPEGWNIFAHHMTIQFGGIPDKLKKKDIGKSVILTATQIGISDMAIAVKVEGYFSTNKNPHITIAINPDGGRPVMSNNIVDWTDIDNINLNGIVMYKEVNKMYVKESSYIKESIEEIKKSSEVIEESSEELVEGKVETIKNIISKIKSAGEKVGAEIVKSDLPDDENIKNISKESLSDNLDIYLVEYEDYNEFVIKVDDKTKFKKQMNISLDDFEQIAKNSKVKKYEEKYGNTTRNRCVAVIGNQFIIVDGNVTEASNVTEAFIGDNTYLFKTENGYLYFYEDAGVPVIKVRDNENMFKSEGGIVPSFTLEEVKANKTKWN